MWDFNDKHNYLGAFVYDICIRFIEPFDKKQIYYVICQLKQTNIN